MKKLLLSLLVVVTIPALANPFIGRWAGFCVVRGAGPAYRQVFLAQVDGYGNLTAQTYDYAGNFIADINGTVNLATGHYSFTTTNNLRVKGYLYAGGTCAGSYTNTYAHTWGTISAWRENVTQK